MPASVIEDLKAEIAGGRAVLVIGAGVSIQATGDQPCASWRGLLHDGARQCAELDGSLRGKWREVAAYEIDSGDPDNMLSAAEKIARKLKDGEYGGWLRNSVGTLHPAANGRELLQALQALDAPLLTTNYDGLLEEATGLPAVTWQDGAKVERVLRGDDKAVLHLHGYWDLPETVVLGIRSYEQVLGNEHAQTVLRALGLMKTLVFVGCGAGLADPNFGRFLESTGRVFAGSEYRRYRLALESEPADPNQHLTVIHYGSKYEDLAGFLRGLAPRRMQPPPPPASLPGKPRCFGREVELRELIADLLADCPEPAPILGPPGIGKSTLALAALHDERVAARYGARRWFIRCDGLQSSSGLASEIARVLGMQPSPGIENAVFASLAQSRAALVLDNAETPLDADQLAVEQFLGSLASVPGLALVATIRGYERPGGVSWLEALRLQPLKPDPARQTFLSIAGKQFESDQHLDFLLEAVDRVPGPVALLAYRAEGEPDLAGLWQTWQDRRTAMLQRAGGGDRLTNMELSYEISLTSRRMTPGAKRLLRVLALLPSGVEVGDLPGVMPPSGNEAASVLRKAGLAFDEAGRLRLLAPLRHYVRGKYTPDAADADRVAGFYVRMATKHAGAVGCKGGAEAARRLAREAANIEEMLVRSLAGPACTEAIDAAIDWTQFVRLTGYGTTAPLLDAEEVARKAGDIQREANCIRRLGDIARDRSDIEQARKRYEEALPLYRKVGDVQGEANCTSGLGDIALLRSGYEQALQHFQAALTLYQRLGSLLGEANCTSGLGDIALRRSDPEQARKLYEEATLLYRQVGGVIGEANCIRGLGDIALGKSDFEQARQQYEKALPLYRQVGSPLGEANCIACLGDIALRRSDPEEARQRYEAALRLFRQVGQVLGEANCIVCLGDIARDRGDREQAREGYALALALYERIQDLYSVGATHQRMAHIASGDATRAAHVTAARGAWQKIDRPELIKQLEAEAGQPHHPPDALQ